MEASKAFLMTCADAPVCTSAYNIVEKHCFITPLISIPLQFLKQLSQNGNVDQEQIKQWGEMQFKCTGH